MGEPRLGAAGTVVKKKNEEADPNEHYHSQRQTVHLCWIDVHKDTINLAALAPDCSRFLLERVYKAEKLTQLRKDPEKLSNNVFGFRDP